MEKSEVIEDFAAQKTAVVVLDPGGSSGPALAVFLAALGCETPASQVNGNSKIAELNEMVLQSSGGSGNNLTGFDIRWLSSPEASGLLQEAAGILETEFTGIFPAVLHATGTARLLPFWNAVFDQVGIIPRYLFLVSDPVEVAEDLHEQFGIEQWTGHLIWLRSALDAEANSRGKRRAFTDAPQLTRDPAATAKSLAETLKLTLRRDVDAVVASEDFPPSGFGELVRRSQTAPIDACAPVTADWVVAVHRTLADWASNAEAPEARKVLDAAREAFDDAVRVFFGGGHHVAATGIKPSELRTANTETAQALARAQEQLRARYSEIVTLTRMLSSETVAARRFERDAKRLGRIACALESGGVRGRLASLLASILPWRWRLKRVKHSIEREGLFDPSAYLAANPDVESAGVDPLRHYLTHGAAEGRPLGIE